MESKTDKTLKAALKKANPEQRKLLLRSRHMEDQIETAANLHDNKLMISLIGENLLVLRKLVESGINRSGGD